MDAAVTPSAIRSLTHRETLLIVLGVMLPVFMGSLDNTILASALPTIGREFGDIHNLPWLVTAYLISNTAITALYGKISDIRGRRVTLLIAISIYMLGSIVCALAPNMLVLIIGRVLHGFGGGGLTSTGMVVLGDVAAPKERGKYYGYFSAVYTSAGACGPALGGAISEYLHWSVIFWMNIPLGLIAIALTLTLLRRLPRHDRPHKLDFLGAGLIMTASSSFMLALSMGGVTYPWNSTPILALFAAALLLGAAFVVRLRTAPEPLIPLSILADRECRLAVAANAFGWGPIVGLHIFLPMYLQNIVGLAPAPAGLAVLMLAVMLNISAGVTGTILPRRERYKTIPILGLTLAIASMLMLAWRAKNMTLAGVRGAAAADRHRFWLHAASRRHRAAKQRFDQHVRLCGRHHAVFAQPVRDHAGRGVRRADPRRNRRRRRQPIFRRRLRPRVPGGRRELCGVARGHPADGRKAAGDAARLRHDRRAATAAGASRSGHRSERCVVPPRGRAGIAAPSRSSERPPARKYTSACRGRFPEADATANS